MAIRQKLSMREGLDFSSNVDAIFGCTDVNATNYNPAATTDDESCVFPLYVGVT